MKKILAVCFAWTLVVCAVMSWASPPSGVTPTVLSRGTYPPFKVKTDSPPLVDFEAKSNSPVDMVVRKHEYAPGSSTGWHTHPGPVFITVLQGSVTFYERDDPNCTPKVVSAGDGYVDDGHGHIGLNRTNEPAVDISVILAPVGKSFRDELPAPGPHCKF